MASVLAAVLGFTFLPKLAETLLSYFIDIEKSAFPCAAEDITVLLSFLFMTLDGTLGAPLTCFECPVLSCLAKLVGTTLVLFT